MKSKICITLSLIIGFLVSCSPVITDSTMSDQVMVCPAIIFTNGDTQVSPDSVALLVIAVSQQAVTITDTFNFSDHTGALSDFIPPSVPFTVTIQGIDANGVVVYHGRIASGGASQDTLITIIAAQVTPRAPGDLTAEPISSSRILVTWEDRSSNELGFILERSESTSTAFGILDTFAANTQTVVDESTIKPFTKYYYRLKAYNGAGISDSLVAFCDPLAAVTTPAMPKGETTGTVNGYYFFTSDSATCSNNHAVEYRFDWGDGDTTSWSVSASAFHAWAAAGTYSIRAQAKCSKETGVVSAWSEGLVILVQ